MRRLLFTLMILLLSMNAQAKENLHPIDVNTEHCVENNASTSGMVACYSEAAEVWDLELNRVYKQLQGKLKPKAQDALKQAQRAWMAQRDKEFDLINAIHAQLDGTMWIPVMMEKRVNVVKARTLVLQSYVDVLKEGEQ
jgi:uncharacterized protein YecT (DUF1311 family)